ncbi:MAG: hypothetical protein KatS3mg011_0415 [Acidimicrobiia bacterium]|nr:MAG: hypothetical protein KatS3mg011_0415 [Acidimicrobiia bacterium]
MFALVTGACTSSDTARSGTRDATGYIAATTWLIEADVVAQEDVPPGYRYLDLVVTDVLFQKPVYVSWVEYDTPDLPVGTRIPAMLVAPSTKVDLKERRVFVALQAAGSPAELERGVTEGDGLRAYAVIMVFDDQWRLIDAPTGYYDQYAEVYALYGQGRDAALGLITDALAGRKARDARTEALEAGLPAPEATTPGPLGDWRRAKGFESGPIEPTPSDRLEAWLAVPPEARQLFVTDDEVIPGADAAAGVDGWVQRELVIADVSDLAAAYPWVGLRFSGVGVLGPFGLRTEKGPQTGPVPLFGYFPAGTDAELVGWTSTTFPDLTTGDVIATLPADMWAGAESVMVDVTGDPTVGFRVRTATAREG